MGTSASSGGSVKSTPTSRTDSRTPSSKGGTPGPRPYSAQQELAKTGMSSSSSKFSNSSRLSNYNTNYSESVSNYREILRNQHNLLNLNPKQALQSFLEIQYKLDHIESRGVFEGIKSVETELQIIQASKHEAENIYKRLYDQNEKERVNDFFAPTVQSFYVNKTDNDEPITSDQAEYLQNLNLLEIAENEFRQVNQKYSNSKKIHSLYKKEYKKGIKLQSEQMNILYSVFQGDYGSELEEQLENEIHELTENKDQLKSALIKLVHSRSLIIFSYNKLQHAEDKWVELITASLNHKDNKDKVYLATEVRNSLAGAYHFLNNSRSYLKNEDMPYCADQDLKNLLYQAAAVYQDMSALETQRNALKNIQVMRKRCLALSHWFETVIKMFMPLMTQYSLVSNQYNQKREQLKFERIRLLNQIIKREEEEGELLSEESAKKEESNKIQVPSPILCLDKFNNSKADSRPKADQVPKPISPNRKKTLESLSSQELNSSQQVNIEERPSSLKETGSRKSSIKENEFSKQSSSKVISIKEASSKPDKLLLGDSTKTASKNADLLDKSGHSKDLPPTKSSLREARHLNLKHNIKNISIEKSESSKSSENSPVLESISLANNDQMNLIDQKSARRERNDLVQAQSSKDINSKMEQQKSPRNNFIVDPVPTNNSKLSLVNATNENSPRESDKNNNKLLTNELSNIDMLKSKYGNNEDTSMESDDFLRPVRPVSAFNPNKTVETIVQPPKDLLLIDIEQIKQCYKQQEEQWNSLLNKSRQNADDRLNNILLSHEKSRLYKL